MKVLLTQLPHFYEMTFRPPTLYPLGLGYLANSLRHSGHEVRPLDLWMENTPVDKAVERIRAERPDVLGISLYSTQYPYFRELVRAVREAVPGQKIVVGGPGATFSYTVLLTRTPVDICVLGEGEETFSHLLEHFDTPEEVPGIAFRRGEEVVVSAARPQIRQLDGLEFPDRRLFDFERYLRNYRNAENGFGTAMGPDSRCANIIAGRGCPYRCTFCSKTFSGVRVRSVASIVEEVRHLKSEWGVTHLDFNDELLLVNRQRTRELCDAIRSEKVIWGAQGRINHVDEETLKNLASAGCVYLGFGVESATQSILDAMKKEIRVEEVRPAIEMTRKHGIIPLIQYMFGFPGENRDSLKKTLAFFTDLDLPFGAAMTTPLPGTPLYQEALAKGLVGDEESYLLALDSGYNRSRPLVNLTEFDDREYMAEYNRVRDAVNRRYYRRHPNLWLQETLRLWKYKLGYLAHPGKLWNKVWGLWQGRTAAGSPRDGGGQR